MLRFVFRESFYISLIYQNVGNILLGQWLNFKLFGITYLVGKIKFKHLFQGSVG